MKTLMISGMLLASLPVMAQDANFNYNKQYENPQEKSMKTDYIYVDVRKADEKERLKYERSAPEKRVPQYGYKDTTTYRSSVTNISPTPVKIPPFTSKPE